MDAVSRALRREVMSPRRPSSSFGLIAVSTMAMMFAISSSLLLFSTHRHRVRHARPPAARIEAPPPVACKGPVYRSTADGTLEIVFEQCPARPFAAR
jgi:hypothetical protein